MRSMKIAQDNSKNIATSGKAIMKNLIEKAINDKIQFNYTNASSFEFENRNGINGFTIHINI